MGNKLNIKLEKLLDLAGRLNFFDTMSKEQCIKVLKSLNADCYVYKKEDKIINQGDLNNDLFIILSGEVTIEKGNDQLSKVGTVSGGDFFGEISFIMCSKRTTNVFACRETIVLQLSQEKFTALDSAIQVLIKDKVIRKLIVRLDEMNNQVLQLRNLNI